MRLYKVGVKLVSDIHLSNINVDSSRRAVEAADNVVHAYDMDLHVPEASESLYTGSFSAPGGGSDRPDRPDILVEGHNLPMQRRAKRGREEDNDQGSPSKVAASREAWAARGQPSDELRLGVFEAEALPTANCHSADHPQPHLDGMSSPLRHIDRAAAPGLRHTQLRSVLQYVVNEGLKVGGRPDSAIATPTKTGEIIEVQSRSSNGELRTKFVEWSVDDNIPETIYGAFMQSPHQMAVANESQWMKETLGNLSVASS